MSQCPLFLSALLPYCVPFDPFLLSHPPSASMAMSFVTFCTPGSLLRPSQSVLSSTPTHTQTKGAKNAVFLNLVYVVYHDDSLFSPSPVNIEISLWLSKIALCICSVPFLV